MCVYACMLYVYVYAHACVCVCVVYVCVCVYVHMHTQTYSHMYLHTYIYVFVCVGVCVCMYMCVYVSVCKYMCKCWSGRWWVYVRGCMLTCDVCLRCYDDDCLYYFKRISLVPLIEGLCSSDSSPRVYVLVF